MYCFFFVELLKSWLIVLLRIQSSKFKKFKFSYDLLFLNFAFDFFFSFFEIFRIFFYGFAWSIYENFGFFNIPSFWFCKFLISNEILIFIQFIKFKTLLEFEDLFLSSYVKDTLWIPFLIMNFPFVIISVFLIKEILTEFWLGFRLLNTSFLFIINSSKL